MILEDTSPFMRLHGNGILFWTSDLLKSVLSFKTRMVLLAWRLCHLENPQIPADGEHGSRAFLIHLLFQALIGIKLNFGS